MVAHKKASFSRPVVPIHSCPDMKKGSQKKTGEGPTLEETPEKRGRFPGSEYGDVY